MTSFQLRQKMTTDVSPKVAVAQRLRASKSGAGSIPAGSVGRDLNLQNLYYHQYLTTSVAVVLVVR